MKLVFLGTRGEIEAASDVHRRHTATAFEYRGRRVVVDCGEDWLGRIDELAPRAIVVTHAHPDHAGGLAGGAPCPVWATAATWSRIDRHPVEDRRIVEPRDPFAVEGIGLEAFPLAHSLRAPAVGYRIEAGRVNVFHAPDVLEIEETGEALAGIDAYVGDGAHPARSIVRVVDGARVGHASVRAQLDWCAEHGVERAIVTHCGSRIVEGGGEEVDRIEAMGAERGVAAEVAVDGMEVVLR